MTIRYLLLFTIVLIGTFAGSRILGLPQTAPASQPGAAAEQQEFKITSHSDLVVLDVSVKDPEGGFVSGLTKDQFKVFDNGHEQPIRVFEA